MNKDGDKTQIFTTILAYSLPILQFFFGQFTGVVQNLFLFQSYFLVVSIFTAVASYVMITVLKARTWFEISPFQFIKKKNMRNWQVYTNPSVYTNDEVKAYQLKHKPPVPIKSIRPDNIIQVVFLPGLIIGFLAFITLGLLFGSKTIFVVSNGYDVIKVVGQSLAYTAFIVFTVLSFAHQYIRDAGARADDLKRSSKYEKAISLARKRDAFNEEKKISLITQWALSPQDFNSLIAFIISVDDKIYVLVADSDIDTIVIVKQFESLNAAESYVWGDAKPQAGTNGGTSI